MNLDDEMDVQLWDGSTTYNFLGQPNPSNSSSKQTPVVGPGTQHWLEMPFEVYAECFWRVKAWEMSASASMSWSASGSASSSATLKKHAWDESEYIPVYLGVVAEATESSAATLGALPEYKADPHPLNSPVEIQHNARNESLLIRTFPYNGCFLTYTQNYDWEHLESDGAGINISRVSVSASESEDIEFSAGFQNAWREPLNLSQDYQYRGGMGAFQQSAYYCPATNSVWCSIGFTWLKGFSIGIESSTHSEATIDGESAIAEESTGFDAHNIASVITNAYAKSRDPSFYADWTYHPVTIQIGAWSTTVANAAIRSPITTFSESSTVGPTSFNNHSDVSESVLYFTQSGTSQASATLNASCVLSGLTIAAVEWWPYNGIYDPDTGAEI